ncbi:MAG TPA: Hsp20/alpha crystallin family protein [Verrucomicrobiae bacterium]|nr:Hsp20/alpha crystallin family protein [Verrucomicrobiae bacterium]
MNGSAQTQNQQRPMPMEPQRGQRGYVAPPANIAASENEYVLEIEMPGVEKQGLEVTVEGNELTIIGRRKQDLPEGELLYSETPLSMDYRRTFELGLDVDTSKIRAEMDQGVLKLHLPRRENAKRRKIEVSG